MTSCGQRLLIGLSGIGVATAFLGCKGETETSNESDAASASSGEEPSAASGAKCGATPAMLVDLEALAKANNTPFIGTPTLAVNATDIFFAFGNSLFSVPIRGGTPELLSTPIPTSQPQLVATPPLLVTSTGIVYEVPVQGSSNNVIARAPLSGGSAVMLASVSGSNSALATDGTTIYFADDTALKRIPIAGGPVTVLATLADDPSEVTGLAVVGSNLVSTQEGGTVSSVPLTGGSPTTLAIDQANASYPMSCGANTCWFTDATPPSPSGAGDTKDSATIESAAPGGAISSISGSQWVPWSLDFDGTNFYEAVGCDLCDGAITRFPLAVSTCQ
jgi:hypothetical protein